MKRENKVFIERAELLTTDGIKAICLSDEEYKGYCKGRKDTENKFKEAIKKLLGQMKEELETEVFGVMDWGNNHGNGKVITKGHFMKIINKIFKERCGV